MGSSDSLDPKDLVVLLAQATKGQREAKVSAEQKTPRSERHREAKDNAKRKILRSESHREAKATAK